MKFESLADIETFMIPSAVVEATDRALQDAGREHSERFVLWAGRVEDSVFWARTAYVPGQTAHNLPSGLCVTVEGNELHKLNRWLYENDQTLAVQVHSHPTYAFHSDTDSTYPIVTQRGGLSIVVPNFAKVGLAGPGVAVYRLDRQGWRHVRGRKLARLLALSADDAQGPA